MSKATKEKRNLLLAVCIQRSTLLPNNMIMYYNYVQKKKYTKFGTAILKLRT